jgi:hypothetical protein
MASLRALVFGVVGGTVGTVAIAALVAGCGDDNAPGTDSGLEDQTAEASSPDVGTDTGRDTGIDTGADARDSGVDSTVDGSDAARDGDASPVDSGRDGDAATVDADAGNADARDGSDASDASDASSDVLDASDAADVQPDAPSAIQTYIQQYGQAFCGGFLRCCDVFDAGAFDAGGFDIGRCAADNVLAGGWRNTLPTLAASIGSAPTAGHLLFNGDAGAGCLTQLQNFACTTGTVAPAAFQALLTACNGVFTGTIPNGVGGCASSFECLNGYCAYPTDGGAIGTCTAFVGDGGTCTGNAPENTVDEMCSQAGKIPSLWCTLPQDPEGGATCAPPLPDNAPCFFNNTWDDYSCSSLICGDNNCGTSVATLYPSQQFCQKYGPDGG